MIVTVQNSDSGVREMKKWKKAFSEWYPKRLVCPKEITGQDIWLAACEYMSNEENLHLANLESRFINLQYKLDTAIEALDSTNNTFAKYMGLECECLGKSDTCLKHTASYLFNKNLEALEKIQGEK